MHHDFSSLLMHANALGTTAFQVRSAFSARHPAVCRLMRTENHAWRKCAWNVTLAPDLPTQPSIGSTGKPYQDATNVDPVAYWLPDLGVDGDLQAGLLEPIFQPGEFAGEGRKFAVVEFREDEL